MAQLRLIWSFIKSNPITMVVGLLCILGLIGGTASWVQSRANKDIVKLKSENAVLMDRATTAEAAKDVAKKEAAASAKLAEDWKATADKFAAQYVKLESRLHSVEQELAKIPKPPPTTVVGDLPTSVAGVVDRFKQEALLAIPLVPQVSGAEIGFAVPVAREVLALTLDGKNYPSAVLRAEVLEEKTVVLEEQKKDLVDALDARTKESDANRTAYETEKQATASAETEVTNLKGVVGNDQKIFKDQENIIKSERLKKWLWGGSGAGIMWLILAL